MSKFDLDAHWHNKDDYRMALIPRWLDQFWDHPRNRTYRSLMRMVKRNRLPRFSLFVGPPGSGKTATAYNLGAAATCPSWDRETNRPCGTCRECESVLLSTASGMRGGLIEIDAADKSDAGGPTVVKHINDAFKHTMAYRTAKGGNPSFRFVVFIDEAHRMTNQQRESLLKMSEQWRGAHLIAATTRLDLLTVTDSTDQINPLLSRAELFEFDYPTPDECVAGLAAAARSVGVVIEPDVAAWVTHKHGCIPRDMLGELYRLSNHGNRIDAAVVIEEYGEESWHKWLPSSDNGRVRNDDDFRMVM